MPSFSRSSLAKLKTCDPRLGAIFKAVVKHLDCIVVCGRRGMVEQEKAYLEGKSKLHYPDSSHNAEPPDLSMAVDVVPCVKGKGAVWDSRQCCVLAGYVMARAYDFGYGIRWGGDWDMDLDVNDQTFNDLVHYELVGE